MIKFMVDSGSDYDVNEAKEKGIAFVPLSITFDNDTYKDGIEISRSENEGGRYFSQDSSAITTGIS